MPWEPSPPRQCGGWTLCDCCCWLLVPAVLLVLARPDKLAAFPTSLSDCQTPTGWNCSGKHREHPASDPVVPRQLRKVARGEATSEGEAASRWIHENREGKSVGELLAPGRSSFPRLRGSGRGSRALRRCAARRLRAAPRGTSLRPRRSSAPLLNGQLGVRERRD